MLVVKGGRLVALGSELFQVARRIKFKDDSGAREAAGEADNENQNLYETEGSSANKIEAESK